MKQNDIFELNEKSASYAKQTFSKENHDSLCPSKQVVDNVLNYAKALEVTKSKAGQVYFSISN